MGLGAIKDSLVRRFALGWLKGRVNEVRKGKEGTMKKLLQALDGWKLLIGVVIVFGVKVYDSFKGTHYGDFTASVLAVFGWDSPDATSFATEAAGPALVLVGVIAKLWKAQAQIRAGSSVAGALSSEGFVVEHEVALAKGKPEAAAVAVKAEEAVAVAEAPKG